MRKNIYGGVIFYRDAYNSLTVTRKANTHILTLGVILTLGTCDVFSNPATTPCKHYLRNMLVVGIVVFF